MVSCIEWERRLLLIRYCMKASSRWLRPILLLLVTAGVFQISVPSLLGQGTVNFANTSTTRLTTNSTSIPPPGQSPNATGLTTGTGHYTVGLYIAPLGTTDPSLFELVATAPSPTVSGLANGRFNGGDVTIPNNTGQPILFQARAWSAYAGPTYQAAGANTGAVLRYFGYSGIGQVTPSTNGTPSLLFGTGAGQVGGFVLMPGACCDPVNVSIGTPANGALFSDSDLVPVFVSRPPSGGYVWWNYVMTNEVIAAVTFGPTFFGANLTLSNLPAGNYTLKARAATFEGLVTTSAPVTIRLASRPVLEFARGSNGPIQFQFNSATGINYVVESGILTNFSPVITNPGTANPITYSETNSSATQRTYRVRLQ